MDCGDSHPDPAVSRRLTTVLCSSGAFLVLSAQQMLLPKEYCRSKRFGRPVNSSLLGPVSVNLYPNIWVASLHSGLHVSNHILLPLQSCDSKSSPLNHCPGHKQKCGQQRTRRCPGTSPSCWGACAFLLKIACDPHTCPTQAAGGRVGSVTCGNKHGLLSLQISCEFHRDSG